MIAEQHLMTSVAFACVLVAAATCAVCMAAPAQPASGVDFSRRFVPQWADAYLACADGFASANFRMVEWSDRPARDVAQAADQRCEARLPTASSSADATAAASAGDVALVRGRVSDWLRGRIETWRATPVRITTTSLTPQPARSPDPAFAVKILSCPHPEYPPAAVRANAQGRTVIDMDVDEQGHVVDARIVASSGDTREHRLLDVAAKASLGTCVFNAAANVPTRHVRLSYEWALSADPAPAAMSR